MNEIDFYKDWLCMDCESFFDIPDSQKDCLMEDLSCIHCGSKRFQMSNEIKKAKIDGISIDEIFKMIGKRKSEKPERFIGEIAVQSSANFT